MGSKNCEQWSNSQVVIGLGVTLGGKTEANVAGLPMQSQDWKKGENKPLKMSLFPQIKGVFHAFVVKRSI